MSNVIKIKRGLSSNLAHSGNTPGELKFTTDTKKLYISNGTDNIPISDITTIERYIDLPSPSADNIYNIYYVKDKASYYYVRYVGGEILYTYHSIRDCDTFDIDCNYTYIQHALDTDKYYKGERHADEVSFEKETGHLTPTGTYEGVKLVFCYVSDSSFKLWMSINGDFTELTNIGKYYSISSLSSFSNNMYYYLTSTKNIVYFEHNNWTEIEIIDYPDTSNPPATIYYVGKWYKINGSSNLRYCKLNTEGEYKYEQFKTDVDLEEFRDEINTLLAGKMTFVEYNGWDAPTATADNMGKMFYYAYDSTYKILKHNSNTVELFLDYTPEEETEEEEEEFDDPFGGSDGDDAIYQEGLLADRPNLNSWSSPTNCKCYYATDQDKYYIATQGSGGLLNYYWEEVTMTIRTSAPYASLDPGWYKVGTIAGGNVKIYQVKENYEWIELQKLRPTIAVQQASGGYDYDNFNFYEFYLRYDEVSVDYMQDGYIYGVIEDAE